MSKPPIIVWFRRDLRLADNPALTAAIAAGAPVIPVYIHDEATGRAPGGASRWWLLNSLDGLARALAAKGSRLLLRRGEARSIIRDLVSETGASAVHWNRLYDAPARHRDSAIKTALKARNVTATSHNGSLLVEPWELQTGAGSPYRVFTPYWKAILARGTPPAPLPAPRKIPPPATWPASDTTGLWNLYDGKPDWAAGFADYWQPGEDGATACLNDFLDDTVTGYARTRDLPGCRGTSRLSPHLHFGEISPRQIWHRTETAMARTPSASSGGMAFLRELGWREFSHNLLYHAPDLATVNWNSKFDAMPWREDEEGLACWQKGLTGYPIVDAGMRELWATGWMHNRVRMVTASFLIKHLMIDWRHGEEWFWDTLVDADPANNAASWQWVAGSGADAAPYFRIFNPVLQGEKFDGKGAYVRRFVPELARLPDRFIHKPWTAPESVLADAGITLGHTYPLPVVDHGMARDRALAVYDTIRSP